MNYKDVLKDLKNDGLDHLYLFYGVEDYLIEKTIQAIKEKIIDTSFEELNYQVMDGREVRVDEIINACETLPFMGEKRMIVVKELECFSNKRKNVNEEEEGRLLAYFLNIPKTTYLFFVVTDGIDKRKKIVKTLGKQGKLVEFDRLSGKDIYNWIEKGFHKLHKKIEGRDLSFFLDLTGYGDKTTNKTLKDLKNEINKLCSYVGDREIVKKEDIELLAPKSIENNIFLLVESIGSKDSHRALSLLNDMLMEGEPEIRILHMIIRQFRLLFQIKLMEKKGYTAMAIAPKLGMQQFVVKKYLKQARNFQIAILREALGNCLYTDESIKKGKINHRLGIELLISKFCRE